MSVLKRIWNDNVWGKVIASFIILGITSLVIWLTKSWTAIIDIFNSVFSWLISYGSISNWLLCILISCALFTLFITGILLHEKLKGSVQDNADTYLAYKNDTFFEIDWTWDYYTDGSDIKNLVGLCTKCKYQLNIHNFSYNYHGRVSTCDNCKNIVVIENDTYSNLTEIVTRKIHRNIRTEDWKGNINQSK